MSRYLFFFLILFSQSVFAAGLKDFEGTSHELSEFIGQGKWSVVMIWAHDCPICNEEVQAYDLFHHDHADTDAEVLGISVDGGGREEEARAFLERHDPGFTNWIAGPGEVSRMLTELSGRPLMGTPTFLLFDRSGKIRAFQVGKLDPQIIEDFIVRQQGDAAPE